MPFNTLLLNTPTIEILGLGETLKNYRPNGNTTIGCNDIWKYHKTKVIVCCDPPIRFSPDRINTIRNSFPVKFLTTRHEWKGIVFNYHLFKLTLGRGNLKNFNDPELVCHSNNSAFMAAHIAFKMGAKKIILHGVDFTNHHALSLEHNLKRAIKDFELLGIELKKHGVSLCVSSHASELSTVLPVFHDPML